MLKKLFLTAAAAAAVSVPLAGVAGAEPDPNNSNVVVPPPQQFTTPISDIAREKPPGTSMTDLARDGFLKFHSVGDAVNDNTPAPNPDGGPGTQVP